MFKENLEKMFNERSAVWIKILKIIVVATFCITVLAGIVFGISDMTCGFNDADIIGDDGLGDLLIWIIIFGISAVIELTVGMLVVNFLTNVQDIREKICGEK